NCTMQSSWTRKSIASIRFTGVCGSDLDHVYGVGNLSTNVGALLRFNPSTTSWDFISMDTGSTWNAGCWIAADHQLYIAAQSKVVRFDGSSLFPEPITFPAGRTT